MKILGPAIIDQRQQKALESGASPLLIGRDRVFKDAADRARVGDAWWVKEPHVEVSSRQFGSVKHVHEMIPGSITGLIVPERLKPHWECLRIVWRADAFGLRRGESRATLIITEVRPAGFLCNVIMKNVDEFLKREAA